MTSETTGPAAGDEAATPSRRRHRRVVRQGAEQGPVAGPSVDERPAGSEAHGGETHGGEAQDQGNDARLREDVPPHWEPSKRF